MAKVTLNSTIHSVIERGKFETCPHCQELARIVREHISYETQERPASTASRGPTFSYRFVDKDGKAASIHESYLSWVEE